MTCHHPQLAYIQKDYRTDKCIVKFVNNKDIDLAKKFIGDPETKIVTLADGSKDYRYRRYVWLPCGKCLGCRLDNSKQKAIRAMKHAKGKDALFLTLTYDDKKIEKYHGSDNDRSYNLHKEDFILFMKRLREYFPSHKLSYIHSGEYGSKKGRAHHHLILYGLPLHELLNTRDEKIGLTQRAKHSNGIYRYYLSETLERLWRYGNCIISTVSYNTCRYVSSYIVKKTLGKDRHKLTRENEYYTSSKGIGKDWFLKNYKDVFPSDEIVYEENNTYKRCKPGRYFMDLLKKIDPELYDEVHATRELKMLERYHEDYSDSRDKLTRQEAILLDKVFAREILEHHNDIHEVFDEDGKISRLCTSAFGVPIEFLFQNDILRKKYLRL